jgi:hypothetical protein
MDNRQQAMAASWRRSWSHSCHWSRTGRTAAELVAELDLRTGLVGPGGFVESALTKLPALAEAVRGDVTGT